MFKSVFSKYMTAFIVIMVVAFAAVGLVVNIAFVQYTVGMKRDMIELCSSLVTNYIETDCEVTDAYSFDRAMNKRYNDIRTYCTRISPIKNELIFMICDTTGEVLITDANVPYGYIRSDVPANDMDDIAHASALTEVALGGVFDTPHLSYAVPVTGSDGEFLGGVIISTTSSSMSSMAGVFSRIIALTTMWSMIVVLVAVYFLSERISAPLKDMNRAAKRFAQGKFDVRVPVRGRDEVAELAIAFNDMAEKLTTVEDMRRGFLANVSHDLRTPMTTISGFIESIQAGAIPPEKEDYYLGLIGNEVRRLSRLVSQLLDISRIEAGDRKFNLAPFDICEVARMILISNEQRLEAKQLDVEFDCDDDNMYVCADKDAIHQVLYNICDNAIKFAYEKGKYKISINQHDKKVYVSVYDEGKGIPPEDLPYVFDRFYKSDKSRGLDKTGVGLGLHICKTMINAHDEEIWVESEYEKYCRFVFTLTPCDPPKRDRQPAAEDV